MESGEKFEWSKDMSVNKADFAMVAPEEPLINAGLDVEKLDKNIWLFKEAVRFWDLIVIINRRILNMIV